MNIRSEEAHEPKHECKYGDTFFRVIDPPSQPTTVFHEGLNRRWCSSYHALFHLILRFSRVCSRCSPPLSLPLFHTHKHIRSCSRSGRDEAPHTLFGNRAAARLSLGRPQEALEDAEVGEWYALHTFRCSRCICAVTAVVSCGSFQKTQKYVAFRPRHVLLLFSAKTLVEIRLNLQGEVYSS